MAEAINSRISGSLDLSGFDARIADTFQRILETQKSREWPKPAHFVEAVEATHNRVLGNLDPVDAIQREANEMEAWLKTNTYAHGNFHSHEATVELIRRGIFQDEREARFRGLPVSRDMAEKAMGRPSGDGPRRTGQQSMSRREWDHHVRVMARLTGRSESDVARDEREWLSQEELPA